MEKTSGIDLGGANIAEWNEEVLKYINKNLPHLTDAIKHFEFEKTDEETQDAIGSILCDLNGKMLTIPIMVSEGKLKKPDIGILDGKAVPLSEDYLIQHLDDNQYGQLDKEKYPHKAIDYIESLFDVVNTNQRGEPMNWKQASFMSDKDISRINNSINELGNKVPLPDKLIQIVKNATCKDNVYSVKDVIYEDDSRPYHFKGAMLKENGKGEYKIEYFHDLPASELSIIKKEAASEQPIRKFASEEDYKVEKGRKYIEAPSERCIIPHKKGSMENGFVQKVRNFTTNDQAVVAVERYLVTRICEQRRMQYEQKWDDRPSGPIHSDQEKENHYLFAKKVWGVVERSPWKEDRKYSPRMNAECIKYNMIRNGDTLMIYDRSTEIGYFPIRVDSVVYQRENMDDPIKPTVNAVVLDTKQKIKLKFSTDASKIHHTSSMENKWSTHTVIIPTTYAIYILPNTRVHQEPLEEVVQKEVKDKIASYESSFSVTKVAGDYHINIDALYLPSLDKYAALLETRKHMGKVVNSIDMLKMGGTYKVKPPEPTKKRKIKQPGGWMKVAHYINTSRNVKMIHDLVKKASLIPEEEVINKDDDTRLLVRYSKACNMLKNAEIEDMVSSVSALDFVPEEGVYNEEEATQIVKQSISTISELLLLSRLSKIEIEEEKLEYALDGLLQLYTEIGSKKYK